MRARTGKKIHNANMAKKKPISARVGQLGNVEQRQSKLALLMCPHFQGILASQFTATNGVKHLGNLLDLAKFK